MWQKFEKTIPVIAILCVMALVQTQAAAQSGAPTLQEQLAAQYKLVKMGSDTSGYSVVEEGTLLALQKGGVMGVPYSDKTSLTNKYENGTVHGPNAAMTEAKKHLLGHFSQTQSEGQTTHLLKKGDKVYPTKIDVKLDKDLVVMGIVACDTCNNTDPPIWAKASSRMIVRFFLTSSFRSGGISTPTLSPNSSMRSGDGTKSASYRRTCSRCVG